MSPVSCGRTVQVGCNMSPVSFWRFVQRAATCHLLAFDVWCRGLHRLIDGDIVRGGRGHILDDSVSGKAKRQGVSGRRPLWSPF